MALPTTPTIDTLVSEALNKAGYSNPSSALTTRATDQWGEEIKQDIYSQCKTLPSLMASSITISAKGKGVYGFPSSDVAIKLSSVKVLNGSTTGTAQAGTTSTITLAADESLDQDEALGKRILITAGTGQASIGQCIAYNDTTKIATVSPNFNTAPDATSTYLFINLETPVRINIVHEYDTRIVTNYMAKPYECFVIGDSTTGELSLYPIPDDVYGIEIRYFIDLQQIDLTSSLLSTMFIKYRNVWLYGLIARTLMDSDDNRYQMYQTLYQSALSVMMAREKYGKEFSQLQRKRSRMQ